MPPKPTGRGKGRPPKPIEQKRRLGNPGGRPLPEAGVIIPAASSTPPVPKGIGKTVLLAGDMSYSPKSGLALWDRAWGRGGVWLSPDFDVVVLEAACRVVDEIECMREIIARKGMTHVRPIVLPNGQIGGAESVPNPVLPHLRAAETKLTTHLSALGFDPTSRSRLGFAEVRRQSELEEMMARRSERRREIGPGDG